MHAFIAVLLPAVAFAAISLKTQTSMNKVLTIRGGKSLGPLNADNMLQVNLATYVVYGVQFWLAKDFINNRIFGSKVQAPQLGSYQNLLAFANFALAAVAYFVKDKSTIGKIFACHWSALALYFGYEKFVVKSTTFVEAGHVEALLLCGTLAATNTAVYF